MLLLIISFLVIAVYMAAVCIKAKGVPYSISATYYTLDHKLIFGASMALTAMFLFPVIWEMSTTFTMRLLAIADCGSAALTLLSSQLWVGCTSFWWVLIPVWLAFIVYTVIDMSKRLSGNIW